MAWISVSIPSEFRSFHFETMEEAAEWIKEIDWLQKSIAHIDNTKDVDIDAQEGVLEDVYGFRKRHNDMLVPVSIIKWVRTKEMQLELPLSPALNIGFLARKRLHSKIKK